MRWNRLPVAAVAAVALVIVMPLGTADAATKSVTIDDFFFAPASTTALQNDTVTWTNSGGTIHTTTSNFPSPVGWNSGDMASGASFSRLVTAAGTYSYLCLRHPTMTGSVKVPIRVTPTTGTTTTIFTVRVATARAPAGFEYVIQRKTPGAGGFVTWRSPTTRATISFVPDEGPGIYTFRSFVRDKSTGELTGASPARSISVS